MPGWKWDGMSAAWRRSSYSSGTSGNTNCVEVAAGGDRVGVRDSKNLPGPVLTFPASTWRLLLSDQRNENR